MAEKVDKKYDYFIKNCGFDYVLQVHSDREFTEIVSSMGGDIHTHRVYEDKDGRFKIYER